VRQSSVFIILLAICLALPSPAASKKRPRKSTHIVAPGDYLGSIARKYKITVDELRDLNNLRNDRLFPGQTLILRKGGKKKKAQPTSGSCFYKVRKGDYLSKIAKKKKTTVKALKKLNGKNARKLRPGDSIRFCKLAPGDGPHKLRGGVQLADQGAGFIAPRRRRVWGKPNAIKSIEQASAELKKKYPDTVPVFIGDISFKEGGYMPPHKSHRTGLDADIGYFVKGNPKLNWFKVPKVSELDAEKTWDYLDAFLQTKQVKQIYVDYRFQKPLYKVAAQRGYPEEDLKRIFEYPRKRGTGHKKMIRHIKGHKSHFHVRFHAVPIRVEAATPPPETPPTQ